MKKNRLTFLAFFMLAAFTTIHAQKASKGYGLGTTEAFAKKLTNNDVSARRTMSLPLSSSRSIEVKIIDDQSHGQQLKVYGEVIGANTSIFYMYGNENGIQGKIVIDRKEGYEVTTDVLTKEVILTNVDINELICVMPAATHPSSTETEAPAENKGASAQPAYSSFPSAPFVLYLDFDGEYVNDSYWNSEMGGAKQCAGPSFSDAKIKSIWAGVAEKYRPWNINVTTDRAVFDAKSKAMRHMVVYTSTWGSGGGVADIGSIANNGTDICWVFFDNIVNDVNDMTVTAAHEAGHAFGLQHDGSKVDGNYYKGQGNWGPIMGNNYQTASRDIWQWSRGEYNGATHHGGASNFQDDVTIIAQNPGVGFRTDDHSNSSTSATAIIAETDGTVLGTKNNGVIANRTDKDYFKFTTAAGTVTFKFQSGTKNWSDEGVLDIQARLLNTDGTELVISNPTASGSNYGLDATISKSVAAGTYYLEVDGIGYLDPKSTGYSDYASCGYYEISGTYFPVTTSIKQQQITSNFFIYPNPATDKIYIAASDPSVQASYIRITDAVGRMVYNNSQPQLQSAIEIDRLAPGIYVLQIADAATQVTSMKKFIKE
jgi:hypothetical protein